MSIAIIVPTYNEIENLPRLVDRLFGLPLDELHLLIIDDNSPDGTGKLADELAAQRPEAIQVLHRTGKLGLGTAYITGFTELLKTPVNYIVQMDADFSHPPEKILEMLKAVNSADVIIGSRYVPGGSLDVEWPFWRKALSSFGNFYARMILGSKIRDVTGGFRLWKREVLESMPLDRVRSNGYVFQVEMAFVASRLGFRFTEIPIYFAERKFGQSKMNLSIQVEAALRVWQLRARYKDLKAIR